MAEQWQALAGRAIFELFEASRPALGSSFIPAFTALHDRTELTDPETRGPVVPWESFDLEGATATLEQASRAFARYRELHNRVVRVFTIYGRLLGDLVRDDPMWRIWAQSTVQALDRTSEKSLKLRAAAVFDLLTVNALTVARSFPDDSPTGNSCMQEAEKLAESAATEARAASMAETAMNSAVNGECVAGLGIFLP